MRVSTGLFTGCQVVHVARVNNGVWNADLVRFENDLFSPISAVGHVFLRERQIGGKAVRAAIFMRENAGLVAE